MMSLKEFMRERRRAGVLIGMIYDLPKGMRKKGWGIYNAWLRYEITFGEAKKRLSNLLEEAKK